jgi:predicted DNA-binding protein (MmcQ/YjbR family)
VVTRDEIEAFCRSLPGTTEDVKWGNDLCFCVGAKMYCVLPVRGSVADPPAISFKATPEAFAALIASGRAEPAPYLARASWVRVPDGSVAVFDDELLDLIRASHHLVRSKLPKRLRGD